MFKYSFYNFMTKNAQYDYDNYDKKYIFALIVVLLAFSSDSVYIYEVVRLKHDIST